MTHFLNGDSPCPSNSCSSVPTLGHSRNSFLCNHRGLKPDLAHSYFLSHCISLHELEGTFQAFPHLFHSSLKRWIWEKTLMNLSAAAPDSPPSVFSSISFQCPSLLTFTATQSCQFFSLQPWPVLHVSPDSLIFSSWDTEKPITLLPMRHLIVLSSLVHAEGGPQQLSNNRIPSCPLN